MIVCLSQSQQRMIYVCGVGALLRYHHHLNLNVNGLVTGWVNGLVMGWENGLVMALENGSMMGRVKMVSDWAGEWIVDGVSEWIGDGVGEWSGLLLEEMIIGSRSSVVVSCLLWLWPGCVTE